MAVLCLAASPLIAESAESPRPWRLRLQGGFAPNALQAEESREFTTFIASSLPRNFADEKGHYDAHYSAQPGFAGEITLERRLAGPIFVHVAGTFGSRSNEAEYEAEYPDLFLFNNPRRLTGEAQLGNHTEQSGHLDLAYNHESGSWVVGFFAGGTLFSVKTSLMNTPELTERYSDDYPYVSVTVSRVPTETFKGTPIGFNVGALVGYAIGDRFHLVGQGRYSQADAHLRDESVTFRVGGLQLSIGAQIGF